MQRKEDSAYAIGAAGFDHDAVTPPMKKSRDLVGAQGIAGLLLSLAGPDAVDEENVAPVDEQQGAGGAGERPIPVKLSGREERERRGDLQVARQPDPPRRSSREVPTVLDRANDGERQSARDDDSGEKKEKRERRTGRKNSRLTQDSLEDTLLIPTS